MVEALALVAAGRIPLLACAQRVVERGSLAPELGQPPLE